MIRLTLSTTERISGFTGKQWKAWGEFLEGFEDSSIHLSSVAVRAGLKSPARKMLAAMWADSDEKIHGVAVMEDSEAVSLGVDDFLEGSVGFNWAKRWLYRKGGFRFGVRVIGTPLASGPHGYRFSAQVDEGACLQSLLALPALGDAESVPRTWVVKDEPSNHAWASGHKLSGKSRWGSDWVDLEFDPVMRVSLVGRDSWEDYLADMRTKSRTKVKRILKLSELLTFSVLSLEEIHSMADDLHALYLKVFGRAAFRMGCLHSEDLIALKEEMGDSFQVWVAKLDEEVIGFHCGMCDGNEVEAFFVGFDGKHNKSHALYQRMLVEFIRWGIEKGCATVNLGRTALDIKASLGAEPKRLVLSVKMQNPVIHTLARWVGKTSTPKQVALKRAWKEESKAAQTTSKPSLHHEVVTVSTSGAS